MKKRILLALSFIFITLSVASTDVQAILQDIRQSPYTTLYDYKNGDILPGKPTFKPDEKLVRLAYQGFDMAGDTSILRTNGKIETFPVGTKKVTANPGDEVRIKNAGSYKGQMLTLAMKPDVLMDFMIDALPVSGQPGKIEFGVRPYSYGYFPNGKTENIQMAVEDSKGNIIRDENIIFLLSQVTEQVNLDRPQMFKIYSGTSSSSYFLAPNNSQKMELDFGTNNYGVSSFTLRTQPFSTPPTRPHTYAFNQIDGTMMTFTRRIPSATNGIGTDTFLKGSDIAGVFIPYEEPIVKKTYNNTGSFEKWNYIKLDVMQQLTRQAFQNQYPTNFTISINPSKYVNINDIQTNDIRLWSTKQNKYLTQYSDYYVQIITSGSRAGTIDITIPSSSLEKIGDDVVHVEGQIPLDLNNKELQALYPTIDNNDFIEIKSVTATNNEVSDYNSDSAFVQIPKPRGEGIEKLVMEGTDSRNFDINELYKNVESAIPGDKVNILGIEQHKIFNSLGPDELKINIQSQTTGQINFITVPIKVLSKSLFILENVEIIPDKTSNNDLKYAPSYLQKVKPTIDNATTYIDNVVVTATYDDYLSVTESDFSVTLDDIVLTKNVDYTLKLDSNNKKVLVTFKNPLIMKKALGKDIQIYQQSKLITNDKNIMSKYDQDKNQFTFPITAYYEFGELYETWSAKQSPISKGEQIIPYLPTIKADPLLGEVVEVGAKVEDPSYYVKNVSKPDFAFDQYDIIFETAPDFSKAGKVDFNVIIKSREFKNAELHVPISVTVEEPTVKMTIKQVYKDDNSKKIYSNLESEDLIDNSKNIYLVEKQESIDTILQDLVVKDKDNFKLIYDGYTLIQGPDYKIQINGVDSTTDKVPDSDFILYIQYDGLLDLTVPNLTYGQIETVRKEHQTFPPIFTDPDDKDKKVSITNTTLNPKWKLKVSLPKGIGLPGKDNVYLGGLEFIPQNQTIPIDIDKSGVIFSTQTEAEKKLITDIPINIELYQNIGNQTGNYQGDLVWTFIDVPG